MRAHNRLILVALILCLTACAEPYLYPAGVEHAEPALNDDYALMDDGYRLPLRRWQADGSAKALVLAVHGLNDYSNGFDVTGKHLSRHGITVVAYDQRGFGAGAGHGLWHGSERMVEDVRVMVELLHKQYPELPLYLLGESMGGAVVLAALGGESLNIDGVVLVAPAIWSRSSMPYYQRALLWLAVHTVPDKQLTGEGLDLMPSDNIEMLRALGRDPLVIKATRVDVLYGVTNLMDAAVATSAELKRDTLILYGQHDDIIPKQPTCEWLGKLSDRKGQYSRTVLYELGYHMLTRDLQAAIVLEDISVWLLERRTRHAEGETTANRMQPVSFCAY